MTDRFTLFEVSWEVCNKVGGIHTVLSTKALTLLERVAHEDYVTIGPWLLSESDADLPFDDEPGFEDYADACRALGVPVRVGRWRIPGRPRTLLVAFSDLYPRRDEILTELWIRHGVDSLGSHWDYIEPVLFGRAAAVAIQQWWRMYRRGLDSRAVVQCHEWMTGSALLHLADAEPSIASVFTTHATVLGRAASSTHRSLDEAAPVLLADAMDVRSKHSLESITAREADVFTTVSRLTAEEAAKVLDREPEPILPNGIDLQVSDALTGGVSREQARAALVRLAERFLGSSTEGAALLAISGRYEFRNKGIDVLLEAMGELARRPGRPIVLFVLVPAGNSGPRLDLMERLAEDARPVEGPVDLSTHNLFDPAGDPVQRLCRRLGLDNEPDARVKVIQVPIYLHEGDGLLGLSYEAALQGMDLTCFPSAYEPWGYTPQESLAAGVPTVTSDCAGFGRWCLDNGIRPEDGVTVLGRAERSDVEAAQDLAGIVDAWLDAGADRAAAAAACRRTAARVSWSDLIARYEEAFGAALERAAERLRANPPPFEPTARVPARPDGERSGPRLIPVDVRARVPDALAGLRRLAGNYWWSTDPEAPGLFAALDEAAWDESDHDPLRLLRRVSPDDLRRRAEDPAYREALEAVLARFEAYLSGDPSAGAAVPAERPVAYFSLEFGVHESLPIYSGGLGVLAGDHLKSSSDLGVPLVGVGLFYHMGFFEQRVTPTGEQLAADVPLDPRRMALSAVTGPDGEPLAIVVRLPGGAVRLRAWRAEVGRVPLYLLDANADDNRPEDRAITRNLYSADQDMRLRQEIVLGKGGVRLLRAMGVRPSLYHLNEGHAALAALERVSGLVRDEGLTFDEAFALVRATTVFTTHTPVAAGHDRFGADLVRRYFSDAPNWIGVPWERFFALGQRPGEPDQFNMTGLALRASGTVNAVSRLHRDVSQSLLSSFWPERLVDDVPIESVTNGVHLPTWVHPAIGRLVAPDGPPVTPEAYADAAPGLDDDALWAARSEAREALLRGVRARLERHFVRRHDSPRLLAAMLDGLTSDALVVGFARRFAPYKRADLLFTDMDRLAALLSDPRRPLRILFAGKAHPNDDLGQQILKRVVELSREPRFVGRVVFLEDHDIHLARLLVQGCDVWLNTPRHALEASGTSGMKSAANGGLNLSIADGWWAEAFDGRNGWSIGGDRVYDDPNLQDELDSTLLYELLEEEVLPDFFDRDEGGLPRRWLARVKHSLSTLPPRYNTDRMVAEYRDRFYAACVTDRALLEADRYAAAKRLADQESRLRRHFGAVRIADARIADPTDLHAGDTLSARVVIDLGELTPDDVCVELVLGRPDGPRRLEQPVVVALEGAGTTPEQQHVFEAAHVVQRVGPLAYGIRVRACLDGPASLAPDDLVLWA